MEVSWPYFDPEFGSLHQRIYGPKVSIDNDSKQDCTVIKVDGVNKDGLLLEVVQVLTHVNLSISKTYISADGQWFMDVFHVKDEKGKKLIDRSVLDYIQHAIGTTSLDGRLSQTNLQAETVRIHTTEQAEKSETRRNTDHRTIELAAADRPGLLSEISTVLTDLHFRVIEAHVWTHNSTLACVARVSDTRTVDGQINDPERLDAIENRLNSVLGATAVLSISNETPPVTLKDGFDDSCNIISLSSSSSNMITGTERHVLVEDCDEKGYLIVSIECSDRPRLMFDCVCMLTEMQYVVFHASGSSSGGIAFQEYFVRRMDGHCTSSSESEKERVVKCMEVAVAGRVSKALRLELHAEDRDGLLSDVTRVIHENGLDLFQAHVATNGDKSVNSFYVRGISGDRSKSVDVVSLVESLKKEMFPSKILYKSCDL